MDAAAVTTVVTIGSSTRSFGGGLVGGSSSIFGGLETVGGLTNFVLFDVSGTVGTILSKPAFQGGGLTIGAGNPGAIYFIENDAAGNSIISLEGILNVPIGTGFTGGLAYRTTDSNLYTLNNSQAGVSTLQTFDEVMLSFAPLAIALGSGFTGGLAWDPGSDLFYALASDANQNTTLYRFAANDAAPTALFGIGQGFAFASLSIDPTGAGSGSGGGQSQVPEPGTWLMTSAGALAFLARRHFR